MNDRDKARNDFASKYVKAVTVASTAVVAATMLVTPCAYAADIPVDETANARTVSAVLYGPAEPTSPPSWTNITALYGPEHLIIPWETIQQYAAALLVADSIAAGVAGGVAVGIMAAEKKRNKKKTVDEQQED